MPEAGYGLICSESDPAFFERRIGAVEPLLVVEITPDFWSSNLDPYVVPMPLLDAYFFHHHVRVPIGFRLLNKGHSSCASAGVRVELTAVYSVVLGMKKGREFPRARDHLGLELKIVGRQGRVRQDEPAAPSALSLHEVLPFDPPFP